MHRQLHLSRDGAQRFPSAVPHRDLVALGEMLTAFERCPGARLQAMPDLAGRLTAANMIAADFLGSTARAVRATFFNKTEHTNWALGWHQDRTIAVRARLEVEGFADWTLKSGIHHVVPPFSFLDRMLTLRIHFDAADEDNAPLLIAPGSHSIGRIAEPEVAGVVGHLGTYACLAEPHDIWLYATPILHASERASKPSRRRVLQLLYSDDELPEGLEWLGLGASTA